MCNDITSWENMIGEEGGDERGRMVGGVGKGRVGAWRKGRRGEQRRKGGRGPAQNKVASTKI